MSCYFLFVFKYKQCFFYNQVNHITLKYEFKFIIFVFNNAFIESIFQKS